MPLGNIARKLGRRRSLLIQLVLASLLSLLLISCETVSFYEQAARGQIEILLSRKQIADLLARSDTPAPLKEKLSTVLDIREFAEQELDLAAGGSYLSYARLEREHVLWNVFAAPEFSLEPLNWCYPIAGCVSYRGYFTEARANDFASGLVADGYDVYVGPVDAYSTLGWFDDPLFSTVINRPDYQLAGLIFHELAHQRVYIPGDTDFNESFATLIEQIGVQRWLLHRNDPDTAIQAQLDSARQADFVGLVMDFRRQFSDLFASDMPVAEKRLAKSALQNTMRETYQQTKAAWQGYAGYDRWFENSLNNAQLSTVSSYNSLVPLLTALLSFHGNDLPAFYLAVSELATLPRQEREAELERIGQSVAVADTAKLQ